MVVPAAAAAAAAARSEGGANLCMDGGHWLRSTGEMMGCTAAPCTACTVACPGSTAGGTEATDVLLEGGMPGVPAPLAKAAGRRSVSAVTAALSGVPVPSTCARRAAAEAPAGGADSGVLLACWLEPRLPAVPGVASYTCANIPCKSVPGVWSCTAAGAAACDVAVMLAAGTLTAVLVAASELPGMATGVTAVPVAGLGMPWNVKGKGDAGPALEGVAVAAAESGAAGAVVANGAAAAALVWVAASAPETGAAADGIAVTGVCAVLLKRSMRAVVP